MVDNAGTDFYCADSNDWVCKIRKIYSMTNDDRKKMGMRNLDFVNTNFSNDALDRVWYEVFEKIILEPRHR